MENQVSVDLTQKEVEVIISERVRKNYKDEWYTKVAKWLIVPSFISLSFACLFTDWLWYALPPFSVMALFGLIAAIFHDENVHKEIKRQMKNLYTE